MKKRIREYQLTAVLAFAITLLSGCGGGGTTATAPTTTAGYVMQGGLTWMPVTFYDTWANANAYCTNTTINGVTGWRMPTDLELSALYVAYPNNSSVLTGQGWTLHYTWSSTQYSVGSHYFVFLFSGGVSWSRDTDGLYVSCVR